eukprot:7734287-Pyramimonas_sp.AAC.1
MEPMAPEALPGGPEHRLLECASSSWTLRPVPRRQTTAASTMPSPTSSYRSARDTWDPGRPRAAGEFYPASVQSFSLAIDGKQRSCD